MKITSIAMVVLWLHCTTTPTVKEPTRKEMKAQYMKVMYGKEMVHKHDIKLFNDKRLNSVPKYIVRDIVIEDILVPRGGEIKSVLMAMCKMEWKNFIGNFQLYAELEDYLSKGRLRMFQYMSCKNVKKHYIEMDKVKKSSEFYVKWAFSDSKKGISVKIPMEKVEKKVKFAWIDLIVQSKKHSIRLNAISDSLVFNINGESHEVDLDPGKYSQTVLAGTSVRFDFPVPWRMEERMKEFNERIKLANTRKEVQNLLTELNIYAQYQIGVFNVTTFRLKPRIEFADQYTVLTY